MTDFGEIKTYQLLGRYPIRIWEKLGSKVAWFGVDICFWDTLNKRRAVMEIRVQNVYAIVLLFTDC